MPIAYSITEYGDLNFPYPNFCGDFQYRQ